jgi:hypothetical protein
LCPQNEPDQIGGATVGNEFESRLHRQIEELVRGRVGPLEQDISSLQREVNQAFTTLLERVDAAAGLPESDNLVEHITADVQAEIGRASAESAKLSSDLASLRDSVEELGRQNTQAEVLNTLVDRLAGFAPRVVLFVIKGNNALGWAARGPDEDLNKNAVRSLSISTQADTILASALGSGETHYGTAEQEAENEVIFGKLGRAVPDRLLAVPLKVRGKAAAVLYADSADRGEGSINVEGIELLVNTTGLVVELTSLRARITEGAARQPAAAPAQPQPAVTGVPVNQQPSTPLTGMTAGLGPGGQTSGELRQPAPTFFKPATEPHTTGERPAPSGRLGEAPAPTYEQAKSGPLTGGLVDEEEKLHNDARRFARLLVSEIKLYNEQKVAEGRNHRDLYDRLKEDIDRSRQMYEKRVSASVSTKFDYFYDELVNTLAEGDPAKLGSDYPGPSARA